MSAFYQVRHELTYRYSQPVYLEPQILFLRPRSDAAQKVHDFRVAITPDPMLASDQTDLFGNIPTCLWFRGTTPQFSVSAVSSVEVSRDNPFDFLLEGRNISLPVSYSPRLESALSIYRKPLENDRSVRLFSDRIASSVGFDTSRFLFALCTEIQIRSRKIERIEGDSWLPSETLEAGQGACRDLAVLYIECCRMQGLAARFASGYFARDTDEISHELHAWCEVYLEGGGWRGYDPSYGLAASESHIAVASAPDGYSLTPVQGSFRGAKVKAVLTTNVSITRAGGIDLNARLVRNSADL